MSRQSIQHFFMILILLILPTALGAEEADPALPDSFDTLTRELLHSLNGLETGSVLAVLDIRNTDGRDSALGNYLEDGLTDFLLSTTDLALVERNQIGKVFQEWEYSLSGMVSEDSMQEIGNMAGADAVLVGMLARVDQSVQVNLRVIDTESALVLASVNTLLSEPKYLSMYLDVFDSELLTEEDFFIGRGRNFDRDQAFFDAFFELCGAIEKETGKINFLDLSFLEFLEASGSIEFTVGSRQNCTVKIRKDQFQPQHLYNFFFRDGRSQSVWYYDDDNYGWHTNPFFQALVEREYDTFGVPAVYREAVERTALFAAASESPVIASVSANSGEIRAGGFAGTPEWAFLNALMEASIMLETRIETVLFRDDGSSVDFVTEYVPLANLERVFRNIKGKEVQESGDGYSVEVVVDISSF